MATRLIDSLIQRLQSKVEENQTELNQLKSDFAEDPMWAAEWKLEKYVTLKTSTQFLMDFLSALKEDPALKVAEKSKQRLTDQLLRYHPKKSSCMVSNAIDQFQHNARVFMLDYLVGICAEIEHLEKLEAESN